MSVCSSLFTSGVDPHDPVSVDLSRRIAQGPATALVGIYAHAGQSYHTDENEARGGLAAVVLDECTPMVEFASKLQGLTSRRLIVSVGSTPTCSAAADFPRGITEIHPGNYSLYDAMQAEIGACTLDDVACFVLCRVVSKSDQPGHERVLIDAGALALSKDVGCASPSAPDVHYGLVVGYPGLVVSAATQEIGIISLRKYSGEKMKEVYDRIRIGQTLRIIPQHSCLTAACFSSYVVIEGDDAVVGNMRPCREW